MCESTTHRNVLLGLVASFPACFMLRERFSSHNSFAQTGQVCKQVALWDFGSVFLWPLVSGLDPSSVSCVQEASLLVPPAQLPSSPPSVGAQTQRKAPRRGSGAYILTQVLVEGIADLLVPGALHGNRRAPHPALRVLAEG